MTAVPVQTKILHAIGDRLSNIKEDNGYYTTAIVIDRARLKPFSGDDIPAINYWAGSDNLVASGGNWEEREVEVAVEYHAKTYDRPFSDVAMELASDINIAVNRSVEHPSVSDNPSRRLGNLISGLNVTSIVPAIGEGASPYCGALVTFVCKYRVSMTDPFNLIPI